MADQKLLAALARAFPTRDAVVHLVEDAGLPSTRLVSGQFGAPQDEWRGILSKADDVEPGGLAKLCAAAAAEMPGEDAFSLIGRARTSPSPLYGVPDARAVDFIGRDATMKQLQELLLKKGSVRVAPSLEGLAGIGKTELALQLVYKLADQGAFPGGIFWFDAENPDLAPVWGSQIADELAIPPGTALERATQALHQVRQCAKPTLIVLDNVETWGGDQSPGPLPSGVHLRYLLTTRSRKLGGASFQHFPIGFLKKPHDRNLLRSTATPREIQDGENVEALLEHLGGHALALELAGAFLGEFPDQTPTTYLEAIQAGDPIDERASDLVRYRSTVSQAFSTIWKRIDIETRDAWRLAACFAPELVNLDLSQSVGLSGDALHGLRRLHLIEMGGSGWRMHRLIQEFGRTTGTAEELGEAQRRFVVGCAEYSGRIEYPEGFRVYLPMRSHLDRALSQAEKALGAEDSRWSKFLNDIGVGSYSAGNLSGAREFLEKALGSDIKNLGENHTHVAIRRSNLAGVLQDLGDLSGARELLEKALESDIKNLGENHPSVATRRSNLALVLKDLGDLSGARELLEKALESAIKNLGENHPHVATRRSNLALVLKALGDLSRARELLETALESAIKNLGENHPHVATSRGNLALVLKDLGDLSGARELLERALASDLENLGENHPSVATRRSNLALVLQDLGDLSGSRELLEKSLTSGLENLGENHPRVGLTRARLAKTLAALEKNERAKQEARAALRVVSGQPVGSWFRSQVEQITAKILEPS